MRKLKLLMTAFALLGGANYAVAQTDVTDTYLTNADFSQTTALTGDYLYGYGKDGSPYGFQTVDGWTSVVTKDAGDSYSGSGTAAGVFNYGSSTQLKGNAKAAPATNPDGEASGNCFGFFGVWECGGYYYQNVTLAAGKYTITVPMYNQSGTQANTTYTGFFPTSGTNQTVAVNPTVGQWVNQTVTFTLTDETSGQIRIGYQSTGSGSAANPMLFIDCVKIEFTAVVVKDVLSTAITAATNANAVLVNSNLAAAIATAQAVFDDENATQDEVNNAAATLNAATELAMSDAGDVTDIFLTNPGFESCTAETSDVAAITKKDYSSAGWTNATAGSYTTIAVTAYGEGVKLATSATPSTKKDGTTVSGNTLGVIAGWGDNVAIQSNDVTMPAGVYTLTIDHYLTSTTQNYGNTSSKFGFVASGNSYLVSSTTFSASTWTTETVTFTLTEATTGKIQIGLTGNNKSGSGSPAVFYDDITITYKSFLAGAKEAWDEAVAAAKQAKIDCPNVTGEELVALNAELDKAEPTTVDGYNDATEALNAATAAFIAAKTSYDALVTEIAYAKTIGVTTADEYAATSESTAASVVTNAQNLKVAEYNTINAAYPNDVTSLLGTWTAGNYDTTSGQGYIGNETYFDKWNGSATDLTSSATVNLPAGQYVVKVAGRGESSTTMNLSVKVGDQEAVATPFLMIGDTGRGIDTNGAANYSEEGTYSNNNNGRGWQYRYIRFSTDGASEVTITINGHIIANSWQSFYAPTLLCDNDTYAPIATTAAKAELQAAIDAAPAALTTNIGDGVFQMAAAGVNTYTEAVAAAQAAHDDAEATVASIEQAKSDLAAAIEAYNALEINAPADGQLFNIVLNNNGGWTYDGKAATFLAGGGNATAGNYAIQYKEVPNANLAQAFTFTKVSGNNYKLSQIDADGNVRYISTGVPYSGNASQIRTVTDVDKALVVTVIATSTEGVYNLKNTEANDYIGSQDAGVYTVNSHINFNLVETSKPSIAINTTAAGYGTTILPFAVAELPEGVKVYTCAAVDGNTLKLAEVDALEANKPYIIEGSWNETLTGDAQGTALTYTTDLLTGTYVDMPAVENTYVLQKHGEKVGFYLVQDVKPTVMANRAYLTAPDQQGGALGFFFPEDGDVTAINAIEALTSGNAQIFDANGVQQQRLQKGVNIVRTQEGKTMKVMVK